MKNGSKNPDADLFGMIGILPVKEKVLEMKAQMAYGNKKTRRPPNVCLLGNPGTGKTTVARILAGFLAKYGYIRENKYMAVFHTCKNQLCGNVRSEKSFVGFGHI